MRKIPTLFVRDFPGDPAHVLQQVTPGCEWVLAGEGVPSRKWDGTCVMLDSRGRWWARREVKQGKPAPYDFQTIERDTGTGKTVGWEPLERSSFAAIAQDAIRAAGRVMRPGTYELVGPRINGNPERSLEHRLLPHGSAPLSLLAGLVWPDAETAWWDLRDYLLSVDGMEGIVWAHPDGRMAKLKARDFPAEAPEVATANPSEDPTTAFARAAGARPSDLP